MSKLLEAARHMDWEQVVLNAAAPCFHLCDDGHFCGRAARWPGHDGDDDGDHTFVSLADLLLPIEKESLRLDKLIDWLGFNEDVATIPCRDWEDRDDARRAIDEWIEKESA